MKQSHKKLLHELGQGCWIDIPRYSERMYSLLLPRLTGHSHEYIRSIRAETIQEMRTIGLLNDQLKAAGDET